jgi:AcrR family transcriptional regulator
MELNALSTEPGPTKRQDATLNRSRLIAAAREVFAEFGHDAPLEEVAARAQVSRTTLYRNFASRQELATEIYAHDVAKIETFSAKVLGKERGIVELFDFVLGMMMDDRSLFHVVLHPDMEWYQELVSRMSAAFKPHVQAGKAAGIVREGATLGDFRLAFGMAQAGTHNVSAARRKQIRHRIRWMLRRALFVDADD